MDDTATAPHDVPAGSPTTVPLPAPGAAGDDEDAGSPDDAGGDDGLLDALSRIVDAFVWRPDGPRVAALAVLGQQRVVDALRAADVVRDLGDLHRPRMWADGVTVVCRHCDKHWPCRTAELMGVSE